MNSMRILAALLLLSASLLAAGTELISVTGTVELTRADGDGARPARQGDTLRVGDRVRTLAGAGAQLRFANGSITSIGEKTMFTLRTLEADGNMKVGLSLASGSLFSTIKKLSSSEQFQVATPTTVAGVRGTELGVVHEGRRSVISVHHGSVVVNAGDRPAVTLEAGQAAEVEEGKAPELRPLRQDEKDMRSKLFAVLAPETTGGNDPANNPGATNLEGTNMPPPNPLLSNRPPPGPSNVMGSNRPGGPWDPSMSNRPGFGPFDPSQSNRPGFGFSNSTGMRPGGRGAMLNIMQPIRPPFIAGMAEKGSRLVIRVNDRVAVDEKSIPNGNFRYNLDSALKEDPLGERPNNIQVRVETEGGASAQAGFTVFWDRTPPSLSGLTWRLAPDRLMLEGSIGEAGTLLVSGFMVPLDPRGRVIPGFGIPFDRLNEGVNTVIATDRAGNRISVNWTVRKPRIPPPPPKR